MTLVVNLYGGPGSGKSTLAYELTGMLKRNNHKAELLVEPAKKLAYTDSQFELNDQILLTAKHNHNLRMLNDVVDFIICDCSLLNGIVYTNDSDKVEKQLCIDLYQRYTNIGYIIPRKTVYMQHGRSQTLEQAMELDKKIIETISFLPEKERKDLSKIPYLELTKFIYNDILKR